MSRLSFLRQPRALTTIAVILVTFLTIAALSIGSHSSAEENLTVKLGGDNRYLTHIALDKPIYRPGEPVFVRATVLHAFRKTPFTDWLSSKMEVIGPDGSTRLEADLEGQDSVQIGSFRIPTDFAGGEYTIKVTHPWSGLPSAERKFDVRTFRQRRMRMQIDLDRKAYGPGDHVDATLEVTRSEGGVPTEATITAIARVDGEEVWRGPAAFSDDSKAHAAFNLPQSIWDGSGTLTFVVQDGGVVESSTKTLPILLQRIDVDIYPEGGDFVSGIDQGFYVEARTPWDEPADIVGEVFNTTTGNVVGRIATSHEGRGKGRFTPQAGVSYELRITRPAGITETIALPPAKAEGVVLAIGQSVVGSDEPVQATITSTSDQRLRVTLSKIEEEVSALMLPFKANTASQLMLTPPGTADGVLRLTVSQEDGKPLAERLIFRRPRHAMTIEVVAPENIQPGASAEVTLRATDHQGNPVQNAVLSSTVTDDAVLEMIEGRKQAPRLPTMVLLENEVEHLEDATIYLGNQPDSVLALDLLLGTQGWRRFAFNDVKAFQDKHEDAARRVMASVDEMVMALETRAGVANAMFDGDDAAEAPAEGGADGNNRRVDEKAKGEVAANDAVPPPGNQAGDPGEDKEAELNEADIANDPVVAPEEERELADAEKKVAGDDFVGPRDRRRFERQAAMRVYAFKARQHRKMGDRTDFTETLYWSAGERTNEKGEVTFKFDISDRITSFRVMVDGFSQAGSLGSADALIRSVQPFYIDAKLPLEVTAGDSISAPIVIVNDTQQARKVSVVVKADEAFQIQWIPSENEYHYPLEVAANSRTRLPLPLNVGQFAGTASITISATTEGFADSVTRTVAIAPKGFPISIHHGGMLEAGKPHSYTIAIPESVEPTSIKASANLYPTPMANLTQALEALIRQPYGCFEQTSSVVYPMVMAQQYFQSHVGVDPELIARADKFIADGYQKLIGFECKEGGYEWFGSGPGHEALTAYGIVEFMDMAKVRNVDADMLARTQKWLESRRDGKGGFLRNQQALDSFGGAPDDITNAYIVWSLTREGAGGILKPEIEALRGQAKSKTDAYFRGLVCGILYNIGEVEEARKLAQELVRMQDKDGSVSQAATSITRSTGKNLSIECTSISILNWLKEDDLFAANTEQAILWLTSQIQDGRFGSTQATVLALKAIVDYDKARATPKADGTFVATVDGRAVELPFDKTTRGMLSVPGLTDLVSTTGAHKISLEMRKGSRMPFSLSLDYYAETPASSPNAPVTMEVNLANPRLTEGESTDVQVTVRNASKDDQGMVMVVVGMPGGLEVRHDKLKELVKAGTIGFYEVLGRDVALYLRGMKAGAELKLSFDAEAAVPGTYFGPASRTYPYYNDDQKHWVIGLACEIKGRE